MEYGSEFDWGANAPYLRTEDVGFLPPDWQLFRSGRDALKALAKQAGRKRVLLPALCCDSMLVPFRLAGYEIILYRLTEQYFSDEEDVTAKLRDGDILIYMPYFGIRPFRNAFLQHLRDSGRDIFLVEDRTQDILAPGGGRFEPDATLASLRKWAALPEGGMLKMDGYAEADAPEPRFGEMRREAMEKKDRYLTSWEPSLKQDFLAEIHAAEALLDVGTEPHAMGEEWAVQLRRLDLPAIYAARVRNLRRLTEKLSALAAAGRFRFLTAEPEKSGLYLPLLMDDRDAVQRAMAAEGVYCPVLWPEPPEVSGVCPVSRSVVEHLLCLPCDQRYDATDMDFIADTLRTILEGANV